MPLNVSLNHKDESSISKVCTWSRLVILRVVEEYLFSQMDFSATLEIENTWLLHPSTPSSLGMTMTYINSLFSTPSSLEMTMTFINSLFSTPSSLCLKLYRSEFFEALSTLWISVPSNVSLNHKSSNVLSLIACYVSGFCFLLLLLWFKIE